MHYDLCPAFIYICECSYFLYLRQFLAWGFRSYFLLVCKSDFLLSFDMVRNGKALTKYLKLIKGSGADVCGNVRDMIERAVLRIDIIQLVELLLL